MKNVVVFGGGQVGWAVAKRLSVLPHARVAVVDVKRPGFYIDWICGDFEHLDEIDINLQSFDLAINCAPSRFGFDVAKFIISAGLDCVDIAFFEEDPYELQELALETGSTYVPDAGFAPGLTNLLFGDYYRRFGEDFKYAEISVGGVATSPFAPYGYSITWSPEDLMEEYERPARFVNDGEISTYSENPVIDAQVKGVEMEGLLTDGLRTLLRYRKNMKHLEEFTLRWPGHYKKVLEMMKSEGKQACAEHLKERCSNIPDTVVMQCLFNHDEFLMIMNSDKDESAMQKATAGFCAAVCEVLLEGRFTKAGVFPPEELGRRYSVYGQILSVFKTKEGAVIEKI